MKLSDIRTTYQDYSSRLSELITKLNFAGIAIVWVLRTNAEMSGVVPFETRLLLAIGLHTASLALTLAQYLYGFVAWNSYHRYRETNGTPETESFLAPRSINWPTYVFFWSKVAASTAALIIIIVHIGRALL